MCVVPEASSPGCNAAFPDISKDSHLVPELRIFPSMLLSAAIEKCL